MTVPTVKMLMFRLGVTKDVATALRKAMQTGAADLPATFAKIDELMGTYGMEHILFQKNGRINRMYYANNGQTYDPTVCYMTPEPHFFVASQGDMIESIEKRGWRSSL